MPHVHTAPGQHDLTASAFVFRVDGKVPQILLHWHKKLHVWMQFGGHVELHETPWAAIAHEVKEESGYTLDQLRLLQPPHSLTDLNDISIAHPLPFVFATHPFDGKMNHYHTDASFLFVTHEEPQYAVAASESSKLRLFSRQEIIELPQTKILPNVRACILYAFDSLLDDWRQVDPNSYSQQSPKL